jgi:putative MATE family efflux protein
MSLFQARGEVHGLGTEYLTVMMSGSFSIFLLLHLITIQRALGSSKTPIAMLITANVANLFLAVLLIYGPGPAPEVFAWGGPIAERLGIPRLELVGAAWATVIARFLVLIPTVYIVYSRFGLFHASVRTRANLAVMRQIWHFGWPTSSQLVVRIFGVLLVLALVNHFYTTDTDQTAATSLGVVLRLESMALFVSLGWGSAAQTFMGQNLGARKLRRAMHSGTFIALYDGVMMFLFAVAYMIWGGALVAFFKDDPEVVAYAVDYLTWVSPSYVALGVGIVLGSAMQGAGATRLTFVLDLVVILAFQLPISLLVVGGFGASSTGLWQVVAATYLTFAVVYVFFYRRADFLRIRIH